MKNNKYTVFVSKGKVDHNNTILLIETTNKDNYLQAKKWAKENNYFITSEYLPDTELSKPIFDNILMR